MSQRHTAVPPNNPAPAPDDASSKRAVYVFGGWGASHSAETLTAEGWKATVWSPPTASNGQLGLVLQGKLYVVGGRRSDDDGQMLRAVTVDPQLNRWEAKASLPSDYEDLTGAVLHDRLYVALTDQEMHNSLLVYDEKTDAWLTRCAPPTKRHQAQLAALGGCLYLIGGHNHDWSLRRVEKYDPVRNEWLSARRLKLGRHDFSAQVFRDKLYVIGGTNFFPDTEMELEEVECYDPKVQKWRFVGDLKTPRSGASAFVLNDGLYVAGGSPDNGNTALASVERFDEATAKWSLESKPMVEERLETCCAVLALDRPAKRQRLE